MSTIADKAGYLYQTKLLIKRALELAGAPVTDDTTFREYATLIARLSANSNIEAMQAFEYTNSAYAGSPTVTLAEFEEALPIAEALINRITNGGDI